MPTSISHKAGLEYWVEKLRMQDLDVYRIIVWDQVQDFYHDIWEGFDRKQMIARCLKMHPGIKYRGPRLTVICGGIQSETPQ